MEIKTETTQKTDLDWNRPREDETPEKQFAEREQDIKDELREILSSTKGIHEEFASTIWRSNKETAESLISSLRSIERELGHSGFEKSHVRGIQEVTKSTQQEQESIDEDKIARILSNIEIFDEERQSAICREYSQYYVEENDWDNITAEGLVNILHIKLLAREKGIDIDGEISDVIRRKFESIEDSVLISNNTENTLKEPISIERVREILDQREERLYAALGEADNKPEIVQEMQQAYLDQIWDDIELD